MDFKQGSFKTKWCMLLEAHLKRARLNASQLARAVGLTPQSIIGHLNGRSKPPFDKLDAMADALRLTPAEREDFTWLAHEAYTPIAVWERLTLAETMNARNASRLIELGEKLVKLKVKTAKAR